MILGTICQSRSWPDRAFVLPFQKHGWHEMGFVGRELGLVMRRAAGGPDDDEACHHCNMGILRRCSLD